jgi:hypothetical protein
MIRTTKCVSPEVQSGATTLGGALRKVVALAALAVLASQGAACAAPSDAGEPSEPETESQSSAIIGGQAVDSETHPYVVYWGPCTGTFLSDHHLLTAKHCGSTVPVGGTLTWTRSVELYSGIQAPVFEEGRVLRYHYDNGSSVTKDDRNAKQYNDLMVIEFEGRPSRDWFKYNSIATLGQYNPASVKQSSAGYVAFGYGCASTLKSGGGVRRQYVFPATGDVGVGSHPFVDKTNGLNPWLWQNVIAASHTAPLKITFSDGATPKPNTWEETLRPTGMSVCEGDSGGPLFKDGKLVAVTVAYFPGPSMPRTSMWEKVDPGAWWIQNLRVSNYPEPASLYTNLDLNGTLSVDTSGLDANSPVYYDTLASPTGAVRGQGPIGISDAGGRFRATFPTTGWAKGKYTFRTYTKRANGFLTSNTRNVFVN